MEAGQYVPEEVGRYLMYFRQKLNEGNLFEVAELYDEHFQRHTEQHYKEALWPSTDVVRGIVGDDAQFLTLYNELYFRHVYAKLSPSLEQRVASWENYMNLFKYILDAIEPVPLQLPSQWLWDIIDEFIYQYQSFAQFRSRLTKKGDDDSLATYKMVWHPLVVFNVLNRLVQKSKIVQVLEIEKQAVDFSGDKFPLDPLYRAFGYFAIIGLLRCHCMAGDYHTALRVMEPIDITDRKGHFTSITPCHVSVNYYVGFAYMMLRRYLDAVRTFTNILSLYLRTKSSMSKTYQFDATNKKAEQMFDLLAITISLCTMKIDEAVHNALLERHHDKLMKLQKCDPQDAPAVYEELFVKSCPKFVAPCDMGRQQFEIFQHEVTQQMALPTLRSYLRLYKSISIPKLAKYIQIEPERLEEYLLSFKHKVRSTVNMGEKSVLAGERQSTSDIDFIVDKDVIMVSDVKVSPRLGDQFLLQIMRLDEVINQM